MKLICKKTGEEVKDLSVMISYISYRRDFVMGKQLSCPERYNMMESDREYYSGDILRILYKTESGKDFNWEVSENKPEKDYSWMIALLRDWKYFQITDEMIQDCKEYGPFFIEK